MSEVKSKEQIIESYPNHGEYPCYYHEAAIGQMMDQWAKQQAIAFLKYFTGNLAKYNDLELDYDLFLKSQSKQP